LSAERRLDDQWLSTRAPRTNYAPATNCGSANRFPINVADDQIDVARGDARQPDAMIDTNNDEDTIKAVLWKGRSLTDAQRSGQTGTRQP
jgi:hypothetical protein